MRACPIGIVGLIVHRIMEANSAIIVNAISTNKILRVKSCITYVLGLLEYMFDVGFQRLAKSQNWTFHLVDGCEVIECVKGGT